MGIEKPYEVERHQLSGPPGVPHILDVEARANALIQPTIEGVSVAGHPLRIPFELDGETVARELRELVAHRFHERRPHADDETWARFAGAAESIARHARSADEGLRHSLTLAIDGL